MHLKFAATYPAFHNPSRSLTRRDVWTSCCRSGSVSPSPVSPSPPSWPWACSALWTSARTSPRSLNKKPRAILHFSFKVLDNSSTGELSDFWHFLLFLKYSKQCCGSGIYKDPGPRFFASRIQQQQMTKQKYNCVSYLFTAINFTKLKL